MKPIRESDGPDLRLELDVASVGQELLDFLAEATEKHGLMYAIMALKGPGGGWPCVEFVGKRNALKSFYIEQYGGDENDFEEFLSADNALKESIDSPASGSVTVGIFVDEDWLPEYLEQVSDQYNLSFEVQSLPDGEGDSTLVKFSGLYGDLNSFYDEEIKEEYGGADKFEALFEKA